jgi:hypothetical protein
VASKAEVGDQISLSGEQHTRAFLGGKGSMASDKFGGPLARPPEDAAERFCEAIFA